MKFLADVNIPQSVIADLAKNSHDVTDIKSGNRLAPDTEIIQIAKREGRIILTLDKDFIALTQYPKYQVPTIVVRLLDQTPHHILEHLTELFQNQKEKTLQKSLTIIKEESAESYPYKD